MTEKTEDKGAADDAGAGVASAGVTAGAGVTASASEAAGASAAQPVKAAEAKPAAPESAIVFYCKDCEEIVPVHKIGNKYVYKCAKCGTKNVAFGTKKSIYGFFRLDEKELKAQREEKKEEKK